MDEVDKASVQTLSAGIGFSMLRSKRPGERVEHMKNKAVLRISSKMRCLFLELLVSPQQAEIHEIILTTVDLLTTIFSEFS